MFYYPRTSGAKSDKTSVDIASIISSKQGVKYAGRDIDAMTAIASAASERSLAKYQSVTSTFSTELQGDLLIKHHLNFLHEQLLESNLIRIIEPYSCVEITHVANLIEMPLATVEKKLSQMILDEKLNGILDQGKGHLIVYEDSEKDLAMEKGLKVIGNMDEVVSSLFVRSRALRTMVG
jgi:26S proteasome regulatory subunit N6